MKYRLPRIGIIIIVCSSAVVLALSSASADPKKPGRDKTTKSSAKKPDPRPLVNWPSFRGPGASGVAWRCRPPRKWNVETGENVRWKAPIPGLGHSSPVIWGDRLIVTTAISGKDDAGLRVGLYGDIKPVEDDTEHEFRVICLDKNSGKVVWNKLAHKGVPKIKRHTKATHANSTPATDGKHVVAFFGSEGLYCYDMDGELLWKKSLGTLDAGYFAVPQAQWEFGSSPVIYDGRLIVQCDVQGGGFLASFDVTDGREIWRTPRSDVPTWSTPTVHRQGDRTLVFANGWHHVGGYDFETGKEIWKIDGGGDIPVPTPVAWKDLVFFASAHGQWAPLYAVRFGARGDISLALADGESSNEHVAWSDPRSMAYMQTPIVVGDLIYSCRDNGTLTCYRAVSGEEVYKKRLGDGVTGFTASPVAAVSPNDKAFYAYIFYTSEEGDVFILRAGEKYKRAAKNALGEVCMATPAISENAIYFRTQGHVIAIADTSASK